jgi:hypothetical protein
MMGEVYYELVATVSQANLNQEVQMGSLSISQFETAYQGVGQGITVVFSPNVDSRQFKLSIAWRYLIDFANVFHLYGPPLDRSRNYASLFHFKKNSVTLAHIFYTIAQETIGDYGSTSCLLDTYMKAANDQVIREHNKTKKELASYKVLSDFKETPYGWPLLHEFDDECQAAFRNTLGGWNDYNQSIIPLSRIDAYAVRAEKAFPVMWKHLTAIRFSGSRRGKRG